MRPEISGNPLIVGALRLDPAVREVSLNESRLDLTSVEFALLEAFLRNTGRIQSRDSLTEVALGRSQVPSTG
jgi:DNA-binding response OmpR family regulator